MLESLGGSPKRSKTIRRGKKAEGDLVGAIGAAAPAKRRLAFFFRVSFRDGLGRVSDRGYPIPSVRQ